MINLLNEAARNHLVCFVASLTLYLYRYRYLQLYLLICRWVYFKLTLMLLLLLEQLWPVYFLFTRLFHSTF